MNSKVYRAVYERARGRCEICGSYEKVELHHVFGRIPEETEMNCVLLCRMHHTGQYGVHKNEALNLELKRKTQQKYFDAGYSEENVRKITGGRIY